MLDTRYSFDTIRTDASNVRAVEACKRICECKDRRGVLWIYGPTGCGKTHLLKAVKNALSGQEETKTVVYASAKELTEVLLDFLAGGTTLWAWLQNADLLLIDNAEYLLGRAQTQRTFADMMAKVVQRGKGVVIASLCPPEQLEALRQCLLEKVGIFAETDIQLPPNEIKAALAQTFLQRHPMEIPQDILDTLIADACNVLQLNGALHAAWLYTRAGNRIDASWLQTCICNFW